MQIIELNDAQSGLARLIDEAGGEVVLITRAGQPVARLVPIDATSLIVNPEGSRLGFSTQEILVPDDFDRMGQKEIEAMFYGSE